MNRRLQGLLFSLFVVISTASAQEFRATITGQVTDSSGLGIPNARVTAIQKSTSQATVASTNQDGFYTVPYLQPSSYSVEVSADGFSKRRQEVTLLTAQKLELSFKLDVGAVTENITVEAAAETVQTA